MNPHPFLYRDPPAPCPLDDADDLGGWMAGGSCDPQANAAYGFNEAQVVNAVTAAYLDAFVHAPPGVSREELRNVLVANFVDELELLGATRTSNRSTATCATNASTSAGSLASCTPAPRSNAGGGNTTRSDRRRR